MELTDENMDYPDYPDPNRPRYSVRDEDRPEYIKVGIANGSRIVEYTGQHITKDVADERYKDSIVTYLFGLGDGTVGVGQLLAVVVTVP